MPIVTVPVRRRPRRGARLALAAVLGAAVFGVSAGAAGAMDEPLECRSDGGPPDVEKLKAVLLKHGLVPALPPGVTR